METIQEVIPSAPKKPPPPLSKGEADERAKSLADYHAKLQKNTLGKANQAQSSEGAAQS